ncbi:MAG TPA: PAS domain S-box protein [Cyclobacteriaceae bacterium]|nr:PAS domain S-box protein [Cyclobacteriaceae bacterium]
MTNAIRIIHLDDVRDESGLIENVIRKSGLAFEWKWVSNKDEYVQSLGDFMPNIVLSDHSMPGFSSVEAFRLLKECKLDIPFILVTATVSEEFAVAMMKEGAADYILKDRPQRLPAAIENAVEKWEAERSNKEFINQIIRSRANLNAIMENSNVSIYSLDRSFRYITFNSFLKHSLKMVYNLDIKVGDVVYEFLDKLDAAEGEIYRDMYTQALQGVTVETTKVFHVRGTRVFLNFHINPIVEGDMITGLACFALDITKEKLAEENLARNESRFRALIENNFDAITLRDENRNLVYASPSVERMLGFSYQEMQSMGGSEGAHPDDVAFINRLYDTISKNPGVPVPFTARVKHKEGHYVWAEGVVTNMLHNENVKGIVSNFRDVTERKEAELQQAKMTRDAIQRNKDLEQFAYIVSHNLRAPLANILGISNILKYEGLAESERSEALSGIFSATEKLDEVIRDLNRILETKQEVNDKKEEIDLQELVESISLGIQGMLVKNNVKVNTDFSRVKSISTIRSYLQSIFFNLITNSIKYKQPDVDPVINITSDVDPEGIKLVFSDNGIGIDLVTQGTKVFGLYKRFHPGHAEGKGMGLFMVKTQVETLGGEISIKSAVNKGTEFTIEL